MLLVAETAENVSSYAVGWGSLALINAGLAQSKNRSGFAWFLLSVFIGPIATFALVVFCEKLPESHAEGENA
jgi:hypothetical protein